MPSFQSQHVQIESRNDRGLRETQGTITQIQFDAGERMKNAMRTTGVWLGVMCGSALIPGWHFILVPSFFITALVLGSAKLNEHERGSGGTGICPHCQKEFKIGNGVWKAKVTDTCEFCFHDLEISLQTANQ